MRFRVWSKTHKRYFSDDFLIDSEGCLFENNRGELENISSNDWFVEYWTGLMDIDGNEIYEGDIIQPMQFDFPPSRPEGKVSLIKLNRQGLFQFYLDDDIDFPLMDPCLKVVGNIHKNPELLENN